MADNFFNENKELYWHANDNHSPELSNAPAYAPHMMGEMFHPYVKPTPQSHKAYGRHQKADWRVPEEPDPNGHPVTEAIKDLIRNRPLPKDKTVVETVHSVHEANTITPKRLSQWEHFDDRQWGPDFRGRQDRRGRRSS